MIRTKTVSAAVAALAASACQTLGLDNGNTLTLVSSEPPGALVRVEGFGECVAPCTIEIDAPRNITVAKAGYNPQRLVLQPGKKKVNVVLELSAPTTEVDETELPDL
ncbi:MAG: PEGA domain-containing protein [Pseudomonadota bacterium]